MVLRAVFSYINPDSDGIACMIAYKEWAERRADTKISGEGRLLIVKPGLFGNVNAEAQAILNFLKIDPPADGYELLEEADEICLVDTHHQSQLPDDLPYAKVVEVIDHHGGGDAPLRDAVVQNEEVGAAATLLVERFAVLDLRPTRSTVLLLGAAILSNTLDFSAPSTTERDRKALRRLEGLEEIPPDLLSAMRRGRDLILEGATVAVLSRDVKVFKRPDGTSLAMSQVEASNAAMLGDRRDLLEALESVARDFGSTTALVNLADLSLGRSLIVCPSEKVRGELATGFGLAFDAGYRGWTDNLFLRKTHLVPVLIGD